MASISAEMHLALNNRGRRREAHRDQLSHRMTKCVRGRSGEHHALSSYRNIGRIIILLVVQGLADVYVMAEAGAERRHRKP